MKEKEKNKWCENYCSKQIVSFLLLCCCDADDGEKLLDKGRKVFMTCISRTLRKEKSGWKKWKCNFSWWNLDEGKVLRWGGIKKRWRWESWRYNSEFVRWKDERKENGLERNENENDASGIQTRKDDENFYSLWFFLFLPFIKKNSLSSSFSLSSLSLWEKEERNIITENHLWSVLYVYIYIHIYKISLLRKEQLVCNKIQFLPSEKVKGFDLWWGLIQRWGRREEWKRGGKEKTWREREDLSICKVKYITYI